jgi:hypothetical protein
MLSRSISNFDMKFYLPLDRQSQSLTEKITYITYRLIPDPSEHCLTFSYEIAKDLELYRTTLHVDTKNEVRECYP